MENYIKSVVDRIEWTDNKEGLPFSVCVPGNTFTDYHEVIKYLTDTYESVPKAFRWRQSGRLNGYRDWNK